MQVAANVHLRHAKGQANILLSRKAFSRGLFSGFDFVNLSRKGCVIYVSFHNIVMREEDTE